MYHLNPVHDFEKMVFYAPKYDASAIENLKILGKDALNFCTIIKPMIRGPAVGMTFGTLAAFVAGEDTYKGGLIGAIIVGQVDISLYIIRLLYH